MRIRGTKQKTRHGAVCGFMRFAHSLAAAETNIVCFWWVLQGSNL